MGSCHVEGEPSHLWRDCGVFDFSILGVGMDLRHPDSSDLVGRRVSVRLPVGASVDMTLTGEVRNAKAGPDGAVRVGLEFAGLSEDERSIIDLLDRGSVIGRLRTP
jgi:PilZ domain